MKTAVETYKTLGIAQPWRWRTKDAQYLAPTEMTTTHLFHTLRMIWNHTMPLSAQLPGGRYNFGAFYTEAYMKEAIARLTPELARRKDLPCTLADQLKHMIDWLATHQVEGITPLQLG